MTDPAASPLVSVELLLDAATEAAVRAEWDALAAAGLSSLGAHTAASNRPHLTVLARSSGVADEVRAAGRMLPIPVVLGGPILFGEGERRVLVRPVAPSPELLALHAAVHHAAGPGEDVEHTRPAAWTPHVTLARRVRLIALDQALALIGGELAGEASGLRRWDAGTRTVTPLSGRE